MSAVPERTLNWLYSVLTSEYQDVNRTYSDVANTLSHYSSLKPRTEVYTFENGSSALLLLLSGTLPVSFRGATYRFPIAIWLPHTYPYEAPMVYVTPAQDMVLVPGNHVGSEGRVYHRYLAQWGEYWDRSSLLDFLDILRAVFAKEAPVRAQQGGSGQQQQQQQYQSAPTPPPVPPPPEEWKRAQQPQLPPKDDPRGPSGPPPRPPKGGAIPNGGETPGGDRLSGPPLPPLPTDVGKASQQQHPQWYQNGNHPPPHGVPMEPPQRHASIGRDPRTMPPHIRPHMTPQSSSRSDQREMSPVSPLGPDSASPQAAAPWQQPGYPPQQQIPFAPQQGPQGSQPPFPPQHSQHTSPPPPGYSPQPQYLPQRQQQQRTPQRAKMPAPDLLTSPLDVTLPSQDPANQANLIAPPIPPNPEKDALLSALADNFNAQINSTLQSNSSAMQSLQAQNVALNAAHQRLQSELSHLSHLDSEIEANTRILHETMREADRVMEDARHRKRPEVDDVLVAPTVVAGQLYREAAEIEGLKEVRGVLGRGLDGGVIGVGEFVKVMRATAREEFLKKALVRKIGRGLGLEEIDHGA